MQKSVAAVTAAVFLLATGRALAFGPDEITYIRMTYYPAFRSEIVIEVIPRQQVDDDSVMVLVSNVSERDSAKNPHATTFIDKSLMTLISKFVKDPEKISKFEKPNQLISLDGAGATLEVGKNNYSVMYRAANILHAGTEPADSEFTTIIRTLLNLGEIDVHH